MNGYFLSPETTRTYRVRTLKRVKARKRWLNFLLFFAILRYYFLCFKNFRCFFPLFLAGKFNKQTFPMFFGIFPHTTNPDLVGPNAKAQPTRPYETRKENHRRTQNET